MTVCRLIVDPPAEGAWNMAVDEALLLAAERDGAAWLRFYTWNEPTLSLGYFQNHADRQLHPASANCKLVRRASGGGAILHDRELTYSIALPSKHPLARRAELLYDAAHRSLIETLSQWGIDANLHVVEKPLSLGGSDLPGATGNRSLPVLKTPGATGKQRLPVPNHEQPFLCFQRRAPGDVVLGDYKIAGSAQRRHHGAVLQHGSVLLQKSPAAPELPGIFNGSNKPAQKEDEIRIAWLPRLSDRLGFEVAPAQLPQEVLDAARVVLAEKFGNDDWTYRR